MYALLMSGLLAVLVLGTQLPAQDPQPRPAGGDEKQTGQPRPGGADKGAANVSLDGNWTVVAAEMNGQAVPEAMKMTVTVKDNVVTFAGAGGATAEKGKLKAVRLSFGPNSTIRVTEAGADGKFGTGTDTKTGTGKDTPPPAGGTGAQPGGTGTGTEKGTGTQPGGTGTQPGGTAGGSGHGTKAGVYVLTQDYLALSIHEESGGSGGSPGTRPGGTDPGTRPGGTGTEKEKGTQPGGTGTQPGGTGTQPGGTGTQPGGATGTQPGGAGTDAMRPHARSYMTVILKRAGGTGTGDTPKRDKE